MTDDSGGSHQAITDTDTDAVALRSDTNHNVLQLHNTIVLQTAWQSQLGHGLV